MKKQSSRKLSLGKIRIANLKARQTEEKLPTINTGCSSVGKCTPTI
ncbi:class I lanthipeptide [Chitinophaga sp.]